MSPTGGRDRDSIDAVLLAYDAELRELAKRAILAPLANGDEPRTRILSAHEEAKGVWARYQPMAADRGRTIDAGQGRARFLNALAETAREHWGEPPEPYRSAVAWQLRNEWVDPQQDTLIIDWVAGQVARDRAPESSDGPGARHNGHRTRSRGPA
jgi:hypothetical protein